MARHLGDEPTDRARWGETVKAYYRDVETYDWVDVADHVRGLETFFHRSRERLVMRLTGRVGAVSFLDAGCGTGLNLRHLPTGSIGIDLNMRSLALVRQRLDGYLLVQGDVESLPFADSSFAGVICTEVLEHLPEPGDAIREFFRILRPGGQLIGTVPTRSPIWRLRFLSRTCPGEEPFHAQFTRSHLRELLASYDLEALRFALGGACLAFIARKPLA